MYKNYLIYFVIISIILLDGPLHSHEIHLKNGMVIQTKSCWEEGDIVNYVKYGTVIGLGKNTIDHIKYDNIVEYANSTIYCTNGSSIFCRKIYEKNDELKCINNKSTQILQHSDISKIVKGQSRYHNFFDMPIEAQKTWTKATIYLKNKDSLLVQEVWTKGNILYCQTHTDSYEFNIDQIKSVKKGYSRRPKLHEMTQAEQNRVLQNQARKKKLKEIKKKELEREIEQIITQ